MTPAFKWLWISSGSANLGDGVILTALPLIALTFGASVGEVAAIVTASTLAWPIFGLYAGWIVDRVPRRGLLIAVNAARMSVLGVVSVSAAAGTLPFWLIVLAAAVYGIAETLVDTALVATIPGLVPAAQLTAANSRVHATMNMANELAGPPLAGLLVGISASLTAATGSLLYLAAGVTVLGMRGRGPHENAHINSSQATDSDAKNVTDGIKYLWNHPLQRSLTLLTAAMSLVWGAWTATFVVHAVAPGSLGLTALQYGFLLSLMAFGGLVTSILVGWMRRHLSLRILLSLDLLGTLMLVAPSALNAPLWVVAAGVVLAGAGSSIWTILVTTIRQETTPVPLQGRVYAASRVISWGALPIGSAAAGLGASMTNVNFVFWCAVLVALTTCAAYIPVWRFLRAGIISKAYEPQR